MRGLLLAALVMVGAAAVRAETAAPELSGNGVYDAVTIGGFVLPLHDVNTLIAAGVLRQDPKTQHFSFAPAITSERDLAARLKSLTLEEPLAPRDLYRAAKVPLPNGASHELTIPSGYGPAAFANQLVGRTLSASFGGVSRVPYTNDPDGALGFGLGFGNSFTGLGASISMSFNDLSDIGNPDRISWGINVSRYLYDGLSMSVGGENLFVKTTDGQSSYYVTGSWAFDRAHDAMPFDGVITLGAGSGRRVAVVAPDAKGLKVNPNAYALD